MTPTLEKWKYCLYSYIHESCTPLGYKDCLRAVISYRLQKHTHTHTHTQSHRHTHIHTHAHTHTADCFTTEQAIVLIFFSSPARHICFGRLTRYLKRTFPSKKWQDDMFLISICQPGQDGSKTFHKDDSV